MTVYTAYEKMMNLLKEAKVFKSGDVFTRRSFTEHMKENFPNLLKQMNNIYNDERFSNNYVPFHIFTERFCSFCKFLEKHEYCELNKRTTHEYSWTVL